MKFIVKWRRADVESSDYLSLWNDFDPPKHFNSLGEAQDFVDKVKKETSGSVLYRIFTSELPQESLEELATTVKSIIQDAIDDERVVDDVNSVIEEFIAEKAVDINGTDLFERLAIEIKVSFDDP